MKNRKYVDVVFGLNIDRTLQYLCPPKLSAKAYPGMRVLAPLKGRPMTGLIVSTGKEAKLSRVLPIRGLLDEEPIVDAHLMNLVSWLSDYYLCSMGTALKTVIPSVILQPGKSTLGESAGTRLFVSPGDARSDSTKPPTERQQAVIDLVSEKGGLPASELIKKLKTDYRTLHSLEGRGLLRLSLKDGLVEDAAEDAIPPARPVLSETQKKVSGAIGRAVEGRKFKKLILHGPPGSGKWDIILDVVRHHLEEDMQAIILVPELSLTPLLLKRLKSFFPGGVAVFHSRLSAGRRKRSWRNCREGKIKIVIGSRSAVFAPLTKPGIIFVCEEQETSYKSEESPRYHAREVAIKRARLAGVPVVLSSSAPSLETLGRRDAADTIYLEIPPSPELRGKVGIKLVDMRNEKIKTGSILSGMMRYSLKATLSKKGKTILFVNRRGIASAAFCASCRYTHRCSNCSTTLAYHGGDGLMSCRVCGYSEPVFIVCPRCGGSIMRTGSPGTAGVEKEVRLLFPSARTGRMDRDTVSRWVDLERTIADFNEGRTDVLVGTQILTGGMGWRGVSLVGVIDADTALHRPDFRAAERTFQLLTQVTGSAGRGMPGGRVVIQTRYPDHYAIQAVQKGVQDLFYRQEMALRAEVGFPPFRSLILMLIEGRSQKSVDNRARTLRNIIDKDAAGLYGADRMASGMEVLGPHPAPMLQKRGRYRQQILIKGPDEEETHRLLRVSMPKIKAAAGRGGIKISLDVDPVDFL